MLLAAAAGAEFNDELAMVQEGTDDLWIFGYGSLVWKPDFQYVESKVGHIKGYMRRFWQGSPVHRGVPGAPGRVVTLIEKQEEITWGIAYRVHPKDAPEVMIKLKDRELPEGFITKKLVMHTLDLNPIPVLVYIAMETNSNYLGPAPVEEIAQQVVHSNGQSGPNTEYVLKLAQWMREAVPTATDKHLFDIETNILNYINAN